MGVRISLASQSNNKYLPIALCAVASPAGHRRRRELWPDLSCGGVRGDTRDPSLCLRPQPIIMNFLAWLCVQTWTRRGYGATAARLTPDQKVGSSNLSGLIFGAGCRLPGRRAGYSSVGRASDCRRFAVIRWSLVRFRVARPALLNFLPASAGQCRGSCGSTAPVAHLVLQSLPVCSLTARRL